MRTTIIGDMAQQFQGIRQTARLKTDLNKFSQELSSGFKSDLTRHLNGATGRVELIDREVAMVERYQQATTELRKRFAFMQVSLEAVETARVGHMERALAITPDSQESTILDTAQSGRRVFSDIVERFNARVGNVSLFGGVATDQDPLADPDTLLADLDAAVAGLTTANDVIAAIDNWFDSPAGGFATLAYQGATSSNPVIPVGKDDSVLVRARADQTGAKNVLKGAALAAVAHESNASLSIRERAALVFESGQTMLSGNEGLTAMRAEIGAAENRVEAAAVSQVSQLAAFRIERNDLTSADPFETASRLQDVQQQLEMHFTVTARLSRLSLVNYLR